MAHPEGLIFNAVALKPLRAASLRSSSKMPAHLVEQGFESIPRLNQKKPQAFGSGFVLWRTRRDSNPRPSGSKPPTLSS